MVRNEFEGDIRLFASDNVESKESFNEGDFESKVAATMRADSVQQLLDVTDTAFQISKATDKVVLIVLKSPEVTKIAGIATTMKVNKKEEIADISGSLFDLSRKTNKVVVLMIKA